jgi:hypothetical protein
MNEESIIKQFSNFLRHSRFFLTREGSHPLTRNTQRTNDQQTAKTRFHTSQTLFDWLKRCIFDTLFPSLFLDFFDERGSLVPSKKQKNETRIFLHLSSIFQPNKKSLRLSHNPACKNKTFCLTKRNQYIYYYLINMKFATILCLIASANAFTTMAPVTRPVSLGMRICCCAAVGEASIMARPPHP